ncbi:MAG: hypothetical protein F2702_07720 [Actinobacteria bacterium]|jgi:hypothetical protein|uniref:Unannotated protein n=1 Tax=freshwater metagenome TaxID=449393 RepID=A0A6J6UZK4_9ZZZZ|nr:hypothetical protein [Actinomycetota bacterium]
MTDRGPTDEPVNEPSPEEQARAWDQIVADLSGQIDFDAATSSLQINDPKPPDAFIDELLEPGELASDTYHPPEPPPIPRPADTIARFAWAGALGGPALLVATTVFSLGTFIGGIGVLASVAGFITLVARMEDHGSADDRPDGGAVV